MAYKYEEEFKELCEEVALRLKKEGLDFTTVGSVNGEIIMYSIPVVPGIDDRIMDIFHEQSLGNIHTDFLLVQSDQRSVQH